MTPSRRLGCLRARGLFIPVTPVLPLGGSDLFDPDCKDGGWRHLIRSNGKPFKNQGQCVDYFVQSD